MIDSKQVGSVEPVSARQLEGRCYTLAFHAESVRLVSEYAKMPLEVTKFDFDKMILSTLPDGVVSPEMQSNESPSHGAAGLDWAIAASELGSVRFFSACREDFEGASGLGMEADPISEGCVAQLAGRHDRYLGVRARPRLRSFGVDAKSTASAARFRCPVRILTDDQ